MAENANCTIYVGNLDERVSDRILYDILIQAGRVVDLHIPRDRETNRPKGFAFAEYETEEIANYAVKLFSGLVTLYNRTLRFAISGQDKPSSNMGAPNMPLNSAPFSAQNGTGAHHMRVSGSSMLSSPRLNYEQGAPISPGVGHESSESRSRYNTDFARRAFGSTMDNITRSRLSRH